MYFIRSNLIESKWHRLDNTANIFPTISNKRFSSVYRVAVRLKEDIVPETLKKALEQTLPLFANFRVRLKRGLFWYYFETNKKSPIIEQEQYIPCGYIDPASNNHYLFKVKYFKARISLEVFHAITDGAGALHFLKEITYAYIRLDNPDKTFESTSPAQAPSATLHLEDSYIKNYEKQTLSQQPSKRSLHIRGERLPVFVISIIHGYIPLKDLSDLCKKNNASITQYLCAVMLWCIYKEYVNAQNRRYPVGITVPVNLRPFFGSTTGMNFFSLVSIRHLFERDDYTFGEMLEIVGEQFKKQLTKENFSRKIAYNVSAEKNIFIRCMPLPLKSLLLKFSYLNSAKASTTTLSNVGRIDVEDEFKEYIEAFEVLLNASNSEPIKCTFCSYGGTSAFAFTSRLKDTSLQRAFFRKLASDGLNITIESNGAYDEAM